MRQQALYEQSLAAKERDDLIQRTAARTHQDPRTEAFNKEVGLKLA